MIRKQKIVKLLKLLIHFRISVVRDYNITLNSKGFILLFLII